MLLILHGALGAARQMESILPLLPDGAGTVLLNLQGHGGLPADRPFTLDDMADGVLAAIQAQGLDRASLFGYSMGGYVALYMAWKYPQVVSEVVTLNTILHWTPEVATRVKGMMNPEKIKTKAPQAAAHFAALHAPENWETVAARTGNLLDALGNGDGIPETAWAAIQCPVTILRGANDNVVTADECERIAAALPNARYAEIPDSGHLWEQVQLPALISWLPLRHI